MSIHRLAGVLALTLFSVVPAIAQEQPAGSERLKKPQIRRADLGVAYLRLENAYWQHTPEQTEEIRRVNEEFDAATMAFFAGNLAQTLRIIDQLSAGLIEPQPDSGLLTAFSLKAECDPPVIILDQTQQASLHVRSLYSPEIDGQQTLRLRLLPTTGDSRAPLELAPELTIPNPLVDLHTVELTPHLQDLSPGTYQVETLLPGGRVVPLSRLSVVASSLDALREANAQRLQKIAATGAELQAAHSAFSDRNNLLTDQPSSEQSSQFLADFHELASQLADELHTLEAGADPYKQRPGDYWRTVRQEKKNLPLRVYAPPSALDHQPAPLVIALHGAGGDENMFFEGYGTGLIKRLADEQGAIVVTPSTYAMTKPETLDTLLQEIGYTYAIDPQRIYMLGHSMGGGATSRYAADRAERLAATCCLAGGGGRSRPTAMAPTLVIAAELDKIIPATRLQAVAEKAQSDGLPVELRTLANYGHTLMVGKSLTDAFAWLFQHRLSSPAAQP